MKKNVILALMAIGLSALAACTQDRKPTAYEEGQNIIDRGAYGQAIAYLEPEVAKAPADRRLRVLLASAYAGRAGIRMRDYVDLANEIAESTRATEAYLSRHGIAALRKNKNGTTNGDENQKKAADLVDSIYRATFRANNLVRGIEMIPAPREEGQIRDLQAAISVLDEDNGLTGGSALYRGLLRLSMLKVDFRERYDFSYLEKCNVDVRELRSQALSLKTDLANILNDFALGILKPSSRARITEFAYRLDGEFSKMLSLIDGMGVEQAEASIRAIQYRILGGCER